MDQFLQKADFALTSATSCFFGLKRSFAGRFFHVSEKKSFRRFAPKGRHVQNFGVKRLK
jgi:hypothetical protein